MLVFQKQQDIGTVCVTFAQLNQKREREEYSIFSPLLFNSSAVRKANKREHKKKPYRIYRFGWQKRMFIIFMEMHAPEHICSISVTFWHYRALLCCNVPSTQRHAMISMNLLDVCVSVFNTAPTTSQFFLCYCLFSIQNSSLLYASSISPILPMKYSYCVDICHYELSTVQLIATRNNIKQ